VDSGNDGYHYLTEPLGDELIGYVLEQVRVRFEGEIEQTNLWWMRHALSFLSLSLAGNLLPYYNSRSVLPEG
jgi:hypothetical protein